MSLNKQGLELSWDELHTLYNLDVRVTHHRTSFMPVSEVQTHCLQACSLTSSTTLCLLLCPSGGDFNALRQSVADAVLEINQNSMPNRNNLHCFWFFPFFHPPFSALPLFVFLLPPILIHPLQQRPSANYTTKLERLQTMRACGKECKLNQSW